MSRELRLSQPMHGGHDVASTILLPRLRLRPGERPLWLDLGLATETAREWRRRAGRYGLAVDVWLGALLEHELVHRRIAAMGADLWRQVGAAAVHASAEARLAPTDELRRWISVLEGDEAAAGDDLPSVVLSARVVAQLPHDGRERILLEAVASEAEHEAIQMDRAAAERGQTLEAWAYLTALATCRA